MAAIDEALGAARQHVRDALASITAANGYPVEIVSTAGGLDENPLAVPDVQLPRSYVYSVAARVGRQRTMGSGSVSSAVAADIWFRLGDKRGSGVVAALLRAIFGAGKATGEEHDAYLAAVVAALRATPAPAGVRASIDTDKDVLYGQTSAGRAILRVPITIEANYEL